jgi:glycosyltransferase involved in cell wall biosynthesis
MKVLLVSEYFYPATSGGTEKYVHELATGLRQQGAEVELLTVSDGPPYIFDGFSVHTLAPNHDQRRKVIAGLVPPDNLEAFEGLIAAISPAVVHFHTLTTSVGSFHFEAAAKRVGRVLFTPHVPGTTCLRGDLMRFGKEACDGKVRPGTCLACYLNKRGIPRSLSPGLAGVMRALGWPQLLSDAAQFKKAQLARIRASCFRVVTLSNWQRAVFAANGFTDEQLAVIRHSFRPSLSSRKKAGAPPLVIGFAGRGAPEKGLDLLINAFERLSHKDFILDLSVIRTGSWKGYLKDLVARTDGKPSIHWTFDASAAEMEDFYHRIHVLCVPSVGFETGPFVMFEAVARDIPVVASDLGGMKEWAELGYPVITYPFDNPRVLAVRLASIMAEKRLGLRLPMWRSVESVAREMMALYAQTD